MELANSLRMKDWPSLYIHAACFHCFACCMHYLLHASSICRECEMLVRYMATCSPEQASPAHALNTDESTPQAGSTDHSNSADTCCLFVNVFMSAPGLTLPSP
eukprot:1158714-Pelagomonas_calceolata.AAC.2